MRAFMRLRARQIRARSHRVASLAVAVCLVATGRAAQRPPVIGRTTGVSAGHPLTTAAAIEILQKGGNAFDAGVAALLVGGVVEQDLFSLGGEALVLVYPTSTRKVTSIVGQGWAPRGATIDAYVAQGKTLDGAGLESGGRPRRAARRADGARAMGHDELRAGVCACDRVRGRRISAAAADGARPSRATSSSSRAGRTTRSTG